MRPTHPGRDPSCWHRAVAGATLALALLASPATTLAAVPEDPAGSESLVGVAANMELRFGRRRGVRGETISTRLAPSVRAALNDWAGAAERLGLQVALGERAECVILGRCGSDVLAEAVEWADEAWELLDDVRPGEPGWQDATLIFLFDQEGQQSPAWAGLFDELAAREEIPAEAARHFAADDGSVLLRTLPGFVQVTWDTAGDAAAGDDEFRLGNELVHKLTQCTLHERFGFVPETLRWGMGYVVEQRLFRSIYQFDRSGFVASSSHEGWPKQAAKLLQQARKEDASLAGLAWQGPAGQAHQAQQLTWAALDYLTHQQPARLAGLLDGLATLHAEAVPFGYVPRYAGEAAAAQTLLEEHLDSLDLKAVRKHIKRVK